MFDNKFWEEIKEKYPKAFEKFLEYEKYVYDGHNFSYDMRFFASSSIVYVCYCDVEKWFDDIGIIIEIVIYEKGFNFRIYNNDYKLWIIKDWRVYTRQKAKLEAVKKAFEIKENQLKEK